MNDLPMLYTPVQVAKLLGISRSQVYVLMNQKILGSVHIGRSRRIRTDQVQDFIDNLPEAA